MTTETAISIRNLKKYYTNTQRKGFSIRDLPGYIREKLSASDPVIKVIDGIDLDIIKGECFGIIGPNGTGKSTLLRLIAGIIPPDSGTIQVNGSLIPLLSLNVGFSRELDAHDNVYQYGMLLGFSKKEMDEQYDEIIAFSGLEQYQSMHLKFFSTGMRVKLGFSTAIRINPDILVLDEVLSVGDVAFKEKSLQKILDICNSDKTVVIVSHSMSTITDICDRAMYLMDGKIGRIGDPEEVIGSYMEVMNQPWSLEEEERKKKDAEMRRAMRKARSGRGRK
jgi:lipopolysaccharide transport system ATP-binding protein